MTSVKSDHGFTTEDVWLLGKKYSFPTFADVKAAFDAQPREPADQNKSNEEADALTCLRQEMQAVQRGTLLHLFRDFQSRVWLTYRRGFRRLPCSSLTTDAGWGCMLRSSQMMFAEALLRHHLARAWRFQPKHPSPEYIQILTEFVDAPGPDFPFSLHNMLAAAASFGKPVGSWFGPHAACVMLHRCAQQQRTLGEKGLHVHLAQDGMLCKDTLEAKTNTHAVVILVPLRLGAKRFIASQCIPPLLGTLSFPQSLGIVGGKPRSSYYFLGKQNSQLLYLDPHLVQEAVPATNKAEAEGLLRKDSRSFHCGRVRSLPVSHLDPSLALAFYVRDRDDFLDFWARVKTVAQQHRAAIFSVLDKTPQWEWGQGGWDKDEQTLDEEKKENSAVTVAAEVQGLPREDGGSESDEYVIV